MLFPNPKGKINVLKRYLHILALLQYLPEGDKTKRWNSKNILDLLYEEDHDENLSDDHIRKYIKKHIINELGITVNKKKGGLVSTIPPGTIDNSLQLEIARVYSSFVVKDTSRDIILKRFIDTKPDRALWLLAQIYFAIIQKKMLQINYITNDGNSKEKWVLCPYYLIFRNNNLYLVVEDKAAKKHIPLLVEKINTLTVLESSESLSWDIIPVEVLFKDSISAYITETPSTKVTIRYNKKIKPTVEGIINMLDPQKSEREHGIYFESTFSITDYLYLCKQFIIYGDDVEIISPPQVRKAMIDMLRKSLSVYERV